MTTEEEASFREMYAQELQKKRQQGSNSYRGVDELTVTMELSHEL